MTHWVTFAQDKWYLLVAALIVLFIVLRIVKTVVKWVLVLALIAFVVYYGSTYKDRLQSIGASVGQKVVAEASDQAMKALKDEAKDAKFQANPDGSYTAATKSVKVEGKAGSDDVTVTFMGQTFHMSASAAIKAFVEQAQANSGAK
jgi:uncharacterized membrane protein YcjF (UPF0283 family)